MTFTGFSLAPTWRQHRYGIFAVLAFALVTALAAWEAYSVTRQHAIERLEQGSSRRLDRFSTLLLAPTNRFTYLPHLLANDRLMREVLERPGDAALQRQANEALGRLQRSTGATTLYLLDAAGTGIAASNWRDKVSFVGTNYAFRPYYSRALQDGGAQFFAMGITSRTPGLFLSQVIKAAGTNEVLGVAVVKAELTMPDMADYEGSIAVTDAGGVAFLSSRSDWQYRPLAALTPSDGASVERTRQYEGVLRAPLNLHVERELADATLVALDEGDRTEHFLMQRRPVPGTEWHANLLLPLDDIEAMALRAATLTAGAIGLVVLALLSVWQLRVRHGERERARAELEGAHAALARQHEELKSLSDVLRIQSSTDSLTGLYNRRYFMDIAGRLMGTARRHGEPLTLLLVDADHFKRVNDQHGHPVGDDVLRMLGQVLREETREGDVAARYGGEEFIVALPHTSAAAALIVAERIRERVACERVAIAGATVGITVSLGIAQCAPGQADVQEIIRQADLALYEAKHAGRNRVMTHAQHTAAEPG